MDIDNLPKPISDALKGFVYLDDEQLTDVLCRKRNLASNFQIENPSSVLAKGLRYGNEFLRGGAFPYLRPSRDLAIGMSRDFT
jgi:crossover junction endodeoxyribonuclease RusA